MLTFLQDQQIRFESHIFQERELRVDNPGSRRSFRPRCCSEPRAISILFSAARIGSIENIWNLQIWCHSGVLSDEGTLPECRHIIWTKAVVQTVETNQSQSHGFLEDHHFRTMLKEQGGNKLTCYCNIRCKFIDDGNLSN